MFSPSELREEVDHSFFDSDIEKGDWNKADSKAEATRPVNVTSASSLRSREKEKHGDHSSKKNTIKEKSNSSVDATTKKVIDNDVGHGCTQSSLRLMAFLAKESNANGTCSGSSTESEEEKTPSKYVHRRSKRSPKKLVRRQRQQSPSSSSEAERKSGSSHRSSSRSSGRSHSDNPANASLTKTTKGLRKLNLEKGDCPQSSSEESVTDVSPLSSPDCVSPLQSEHQNHEEAKDPAFKEVQQPESVPSSGLSDIHHEDELHLDEDESSFSSECQFQNQLLFRLPRANTRKNFSFSNDEVRRIDRENQRLLQELCRFSPSSRPGSVAGQRSHIGNRAAYVRPSHSALNRQRDQKRIERENLAFLKRLEAVKPTRGLKRSEQLADYQRKNGYQGVVPSNFSYTYMEKQELTSSRMWSANRGQRTTSVSPQDASPASLDSHTCSTTSARKSKKVSASQALPAWN